MGQYYIPMIISPRKISTLSSHQYGNGLKLMEHSYIGNNFVNAVAGLIYKKPCRVAWMGDYADDKYGDPYESKIPRAALLKYYRMAWRDDREKRMVRPDDSVINMADPGLFLINHTQKEYIDLDHYRRESEWFEENNMYDPACDPFVQEPWCINPLPLLTACGNGRGGGDYHDCFPNYDKVGIWAFDSIELSDEKPADYSLFTVVFSEKERKIA